MHFVVFHFYLLLSLFRSYCTCEGHSLIVCLRAYNYSKVKQQEVQLIRGETNEWLEPDGAQRKMTKKIITGWNKHYSVFCHSAFSPCSAPFPFPPRLPFHFWQFFFLTKTIVIAYWRFLELSVCLTVRIIEYQIH